MAGCTGITGDAGTPVAIEFVTSQTPPLRLEEFDTVLVRVRVRNSAGDTIAGAPVRLVSLNPDTVAVDSAIFGLVGVQPGPGRVVAFSGSLASDPLQVGVVRAPDSLVVVGSSLDSVAAADSVSDSLKAGLLDLRTNPAQPTPLGSGYQVTFTIVFPAPAVLSADSVTLGNDSLTQVRLTGTAGTAFVMVRHARTRTDSVVVQASATRAVGTTVNGSPLQFIVRFQ